MLAAELGEYCGKNAIVGAILRGGLIVALEIAEAIGGEIEIILAKKLGAPGNPELAVGAVSENGKVVVNKSIASKVGADEQYIDVEHHIQSEQIELLIKKYRGILPKRNLTGRTVILTDDGVATGATMKASIWTVRQENPETLIVALPVGPEETVKDLSKYVDELVCLRAPHSFSAVGQFYEEFDQVDESDVMRILKKESCKWT